jgi:hypothetical protein
MSNPLLFQTLHPFRGDPRASQLSFDAGETLAVDNPVKANVHGWGWGRRMNSQHHRRYGWFPVTYVRQIPAAVSQQRFPVGTGATARTYPSKTASFHVNADDDDSGFEGEPMGGMAKPQPVNEYAKAFDCGITSPERRINRAGKKIGARISNVATSARSMASNGVSKTATATRSSFQEMGHRWNDMKDQHNADLDDKNSPYTSAPAYQQQEHQCDT